MRLCLVAAVRSRCLLQGATSLSVAGIEYELLPDSDGLLAEIRASAPLSSDEEIPQIVSVDDSPPLFRYPPSPTYDRLLDTLKYIESLGSFWLKIEEVEWYSATAEWIPETDEEDEQLQLRSFQRRLSYPVTSLPFEEKVLVELLQDRERNDRWVLPLALFRQANNDHLCGRYATAFAGFYFFLEDLFGEGKTKNRQVQEAFKSNSELMQISTNVVRILEAPENSEHRSNVQRWLGHRDLSPATILDLLVSMRGDLFHFSTKSTRPKAHPMNENEFESLSYLAMHFCILTYVGRVDEP